MVVLFSLALLALVLTAVVGYGALFVAATSGPALRRLDAADASAVAGIAYRVGALGNEQACYLVGPAGLAVVATSDQRIPWSAPWVWAALALWAATIVVRAAVVQPARRTTVVTLGELAGSRSEHETRRAHLGATIRRMNVGAALCAALFVAACALVAFHPGT